MLISIESDIFLTGFSLKTARHPFCSNSAQENSGEGYLCIIVTNGKKREKKKAKIE